MGESDELHQADHTCLPLRLDVEELEDTRAEDLGSQGDVLRRGLALDGDLHLGPVAGRLDVDVQTADADQHPRERELVEALPCANDELEPQGLGVILFVEHGGWMGCRDRIRSACKAWGRMKRSESGSRF